MNFLIMDLSGQGVVFDQKGILRPSTPHRIWRIQQACWGKSEINHHKQLDLWVSGCFRHRDNEWTGTSAGNDAFKPHHSLALGPSLCS